MLFAEGYEVLFLILEVVLESIEGRLQIVSDFRFLFLFLFFVFVEVEEGFELVNFLCGVHLIFTKDLL
jgi:hypothetical protein